jgi:tRNA pseudouridine38-40 synthase
MVRLLVQGLIDIGTGELSLNQFEALLNTSEPNKKNKPAYPQGLYLSRVEYPFIENQNQSTFFNLLENSNWIEL